MFRKLRAAQEQSFSIKNRQTLPVCLRVRASHHVYHLNLVKFADVCTMLPEPPISQYNHLKTRFQFSVWHLDGVFEAELTYLDGHQKFPSNTVHVSRSEEKI
jgi:hypothetical protein